MDEKNSVLVGVDGTDASYKATWWAANYAKHANLELQIVCAYSLPSYAAVSFDATYTALGDDVVAHTDAQEILSKAKAIAHEQGVDATTLIVTGDPSSVFVELSRNYKLIVIGNRSKGGMAERLLGTTSSSLPAYAYCPIVVVPLHNEDHEVLHLNNIVQKVVVGSDETRWGLKALQIAADLANSWGADLEVLSAAPVSSGAGSFFGSDGHDEQNRVIEAYTEDLDSRVAPIAKAYPNLHIAKKVIPGSAVDAILKESSEDDIIVVGSRGRGGFTGLILGSTSQSLIQHATSPVYVVPRKFVEASELDEKKALAAQTVDTKSIDEISGVQEVKVPEVGQEVAAAIDSAIDPEHE